MSVYSVGSGSQAIQQGLRHLNDATARIARDSTAAANPKTEAKAAGLDKSLVEMKETSAQTQVAVKAVKAQDGMIGTLFDDYA